MKRICLITLSILLIFTLTSCAKNNTTGNKADASARNGKILIVYFSRVGNTNFPKDVDAIASASINYTKSELKGNTGIIADIIHDAVGGDVVLIQTANKYPSDFKATLDYAKKEQKQGIYPELNIDLKNIDQYDTIFLGFPTWWYDMPMPVYSFLKQYNLSGKTVIPFCTHEASKFSGSIETLKKLLPNAKILDGLAIKHSKINDSNTKDNVLKWLHDIGMSK